MPDFLFKRDCLFCGQICEPKDPKHPQRWEPVSKCETEKRPGQPTFKQVILDICDECQDDWSRVVEIKVNAAPNDLSSDITGILAQMIDDPSTCPLPYYRAPNTDD